MKIAVVGSGIGGLGAAWLLSREHDVDVYEADDRLGGHAHTSEIDVNGVKVPVDTGFMVYNYRTYPNLTGLFGMIDVDEHDADMGFSVQCAFDLVEWSSKWHGVFAQPRNLVRGKFWHMLYDLVRFNRASDRILRETSDEMGLGEVLERQGVGEGFKQWYFVPMGSAIWSTRPMEMLDFPAQTFLRFMDNHGLLQIVGHPDWKSVVGGSARYVEFLAGDVSGDIHTSAPVRRVRREPGRVVVESAAGEAAYDAVVVGTHPGETLGMLEDADEEEREILSAFKYQSNPTCVHCDQRFLPTAQRAHAAWNYFAETGRIDSDHLSVTYYLNKLQQLGTEHAVLVTLNPFVSPAAADIFFEIDYEHPVFDRPAILAQRRVPDIQGRGGVYYTGAWQRYGFHEDGLWSAVRVAESLGITAPWKEKGAATVSEAEVASA